MLHFEELKKILDELGVDAYPVPAQNTLYCSFEVDHDGLYDACLCSITIKSDNIIFCSFYNGNVPNEKTDLIRNMLEAMNGMTLSGHFDIDEDFNEICFKTGAPLPLESSITREWLKQQIAINQNTFSHYYPAFSETIRGSIASPAGYRLYRDDLESEGEDTVLAVANLQ